MVDEGVGGAADEADVLVPARVVVPSSGNFRTQSMVMDPITAMCMALPIDSVVNLRVLAAGDG